MAKKDNYYFEAFSAGVQFACDAALLLQKDFANYVPEELPARIVDMHEVEHNADMAKHEMLKHLSSGFFTPLCREDLMVLADSIDDVIDGIDDILMHAYMFNIKKPRPEALEFTGVILSCCQALKAMMGEMPEYRKSPLLHDRIVELNRLEETGDRLYTTATHALYTTETDPVQVLVWTALFERMEKCCDACEFVADVVEKIILKNS